MNFLVMAQLSKSKYIKLEKLLEAHPHHTSGALYHPLNRPSYNYSN